MMEFPFARKSLAGARRRLKRPAIVLQSRAMERYKRPIGPTGRDERV
jgi:hypothetical protein